MTDEEHHPTLTHLDDASVALDLPVGDVRTRLIGVLPELLGFAGLHDDEVIDKDVAVDIAGERRIEVRDRSLDVDGETLPPLIDMGVTNDLLHEWVVVLDAVHARAEHAREDQVGIRVGGCPP